MNYHGRNTVWGFRERVRKNLVFISFARNMGADVHIVTELITSLLGLIVFPYEEAKRSGKTSMDNFKLDDLSCLGWPRWRFYLGSSDNLEDLVRHLRNAISHRRLNFSSDSRKLEEVEIKFWDRKNPKGPDDWRASINADDLMTFVLLFSDLLMEWETDYS
jgi:hypothetical protein